MNISDHITGVFRERLDKHSALVVYDPDHRYELVCEGMADKHTTVVHAGRSYFGAREDALRHMRTVASPSKDGERRYLLVYIPAPAPLNDQARIADPFSAVAVAGHHFPVGDGENYEALCRTAKPDHATEIARLFQEGTPDFAVIDALGDRGGWPQLKAVLGAESPAEILKTFMVPPKDKLEGMDQADAWVSEIRRFLETSLGVTLRTKGKRWNSVSQEVWEIMLLSEFVYDMPDGVPEALQEMQWADQVAKELVNKVCAALRNDRSAQETYMDQASRVADTFQLARHVADIDDLGIRDTFAFEERSFINRYIQSALRGDFGAAREIDQVHGDSIWLQDTDCFAQWTIARKALALLTIEADTKRLMDGKTGNLQALVGAYTSSGREVDRAYRELEQAISESFQALEILESLVTQARTAYRKFASEMQACFIGHFESEGWPVDGTRSNTRVFDEVVAPLLEERKKVAYVMIDALRYELGVELHKKLAESVPATLSISCAQLPTITPVGMSSLLPLASEKLAIKKDKDGKLTPCMGEMFTPSAPGRDKWFKSIYGDRYMDIQLRDFVEKKKLSIADSVQLLTVRSWDIDRHLHNSPRQLVRSIPEYLSLIQSAVYRLQEHGFDKAVVVTDHGFILLHDFQAGDAGDKPEGDWILKKDRCLLGKGIGNSANLVVKKEHVDIRGDFDDYATPRRLGLYKQEEEYFHSGASLQETILPVIILDLAKDGEESNPDDFTVGLSYRRGETSEVTTLAPMVELSVTTPSLFNQAQHLEVLLEILGPKKEKVGRVSASGDHVNSATGAVTIPVGSSVKVRLMLDDEFRGKFTVNALDPSSRALHHTLKLNVKITE